jgi:hypothetical protein
MSSSIGYICPSCYTKNAARHDTNCVYYRHHMLNAGVPREVTMLPSTFKVSDPTLPGEYQVRQYAIYVTNAGREVRLVLKIKEDLTPYESWALSDLMFDRVEGNIMAYILDKKLIRHFREEPLPEVDKQMKQQELEMIKQAILSKSNTVFYSQQYESETLTLDKLYAAMASIEKQP